MAGFIELDRVNERYKELEYFNLVLDCVETHKEHYYEVYEEYPDGNEEPMNFRTFSHANRYFDNILKEYEA